MGREAQIEDSSSFVHRHGLVDPSSVVMDSFFGTKGGLMPFMQKYTRLSDFLVLSHPILQKGYKLCGKSVPRTLFDHFLQLGCLLS